MRETIYRIGIGLYLLWLLSVVLLILGRYSFVPLFDFVRTSVVFGTVVLTLFGAGQLVRTGYRRLAR